MSRTIVEIKEQVINLARWRSAFRSSGEFSSIEETESDENEYIASTS
ncbi:hypothetical protein MTR67_048649 [Solanum verrucosum]|uniref:Uncharacterized protein n=1 Tax=Solanum verrucosum TaxID=315347 RepID=A0AAF1A0A2_SOLVR|nr:hypothetical protein MTR67_048649 [Solanum verrucosum]